MNFLGHAVLSFNHPDILAGNMAGDFFKGKKILENIPQELAKGVLLHRFIDHYTDQHRAIGRAKIWFRPYYGLFSGALVDVAMDHFLANDPMWFEDDQSLKSFSTATYQQLQEKLNHLPIQFQRVFPYMKNEDWLYSYRKVKSMEKAFVMLSKRSERFPDGAEAYKIFISHYYELNQCYLDLIDDAQKAVKIELSI